VLGVGVTVETTETEATRGQGGRRGIVVAADWARVVIGAVIALGALGISLGSYEGASQEGGT
jgi:hypothetical protein